MMEMPSRNALKAAAVLCLTALCLGYGFGQLSAAKTAGALWVVALFLPTQILAMSAAERTPKGSARIAWFVANALILGGFLWVASLILAK